MNIILCIDKSGGMMFNNRRQSQDKMVVSKIIEIVADSRLLVSDYSAKLFCDYSNIYISNNIVCDAQLGDFYFVEDNDFPVDNIEDIYIFNWNRDYPADKYFSFDLKLNNFRKIKKEDFEGNSHKKITLEIYRRV